jgi:hypothetical protein
VSMQTDPSGLSALIRRVESPEFDAGISGGEAPVDPLGARVSTRGLGGHGVLHRRPVARPLPQTLAGEHAQFEFGHVQPTPVVGGWWISSLSVMRLASAGGKAAYSEAGEWMLS